VHALNLTCIWPFIGTLHVPRCLEFIQRCPLGRVGNNPKCLNNRENQIEYVPNNSHASNFHNSKVKAFIGFYAFDFIELAT